jgi:hypothetical protein
MSTERLTGRTRFRIAPSPIAGGYPVLVLQVEVGGHNSPIKHWRDARVEDLSQSDTTPALKVAP